MASKLETEVEVTSPADKFWGSIRDSTELFPKIFPQHYQSIKVIEGDGKSDGNKSAIDMVAGVPFVKFAKEKVEFVDDANKQVKYSVIDGELLSYYKSFRPTLQVASKGDGVAVVKWTVEYEKVNDEVPPPELIQEMAVQTFKDLDAYLLKN
ncbi:MLP-like protein 423 [Phalaenopsis equestris]|uniref:MLP-like protein 423 n=1 Tax=Phalaenopsis equestris TaxID=78828 RepID=UPI0009E24E91|nr:MLP-like protein 423 [Phalaenopsis equestris]